MAFAWRGDVLEALHAAADAFNLDRALVRAVCYIESRGKPDAQSGAGAQGLMQLMPDTARELGVTDAFDPAQNARGGAKYLRQMLTQFGGDLRKALAAYNWGPGNVERRTTIPASVQKYASDVIARYNVERGEIPPLVPQPPGAPVACFSCSQCGSRFEVVAVAADGGQHDDVG
jgi:soluble lytic murein transglycosylase-like protein